MTSKLIISDHHDFSLEEQYFFLNGEKYEYFLAYGSRGLNERIVELPLVCKYIQEHIGKNILEVGSIFTLLLGDVFDAVDLTEKGENIINVDIAHYKPNKKYDLILSLSTIEHFGHGDYGDEKDPIKLKKALKHIISLLSDEGTFFATAPIGWNLQLDGLIRRKQLPFQDIYFMKRISSGVWKQVDLNGALEAKYNYPYPNANAIMIGVCQK